MLPAGLQVAGSRKEITLSKLLLVEGNDAFQLFKALVRHLDLLGEIEIRNYGGVTHLADYLEALPVVSGWAGVTQLGIVRDAEQRSVDSAFQSVCRGLQNAGLSVPAKPKEAAGQTPSVSVFVLPDCSAPGMLETLLLQTVADDPAWSCVKGYFECLQAQSDELPHSLEKAKLQVFLASRPEYVAHLGEAAHKGYWPWDNPVLDELKRFLLAL